jgi:hypothetical protein
MNTNWMHGSGRCDGLIGKKRRMWDEVVRAFNGVLAKTSHMEMCGDAMKMMRLYAILDFPD